MKIYIRGLLRPQNRWKYTSSGKDMFKISGDVFLADKKSLCGRTLGHTGLVKHNENIKDHKNTNSDSLKPFSVSYSTILDDSCCKFEGIATCSPWEGSRKLEIKNHALASDRFMLRGSAQYVWDLISKGQRNPAGPASLGPCVHGQLKKNKINPKPCQSYMTPTSDYKTSPLNKPHSGLMEGPKP